jgi:hypothetical protein
VGETRAAWRRRALLLGLLAAPVLAFQYGPRLGRVFDRGFDFEPIDDPAGFRRIAAGKVSSGVDPWVGLSVPGDRDTAQRRPPPDLCDALFRGLATPGIVPIASFSDYNCPYCRVLTRRLAKLAIILHAMWKTNTPFRWNRADA